MGSWHLELDPAVEPRHPDGRCGHLFSQSVYEGPTAVTRYPVSPYERLQLRLRGFIDQFSPSVITTPIGLEILDI